MNNPGWSPPRPSSNAAQINASAFRVRCREEMRDAHQEAQDLDKKLSAEAKAVKATGRTARAALPPDALAWLSRGVEELRWFGAPTAGRSMREGRSIYYLKLTH